MSSEAYSPRHASFQGHPNPLAYYIVKRIIATDNASRIDAEDVAYGAGYRQALDDLVDFLAEMERA